MTSCAHELAALAILHVDSPVGRLELAATAEKLLCITMESQGFLLEGGGRGTQNPVLRETRLQLEAYFSGRLTTFDLPLGASGTAFRERVWSALLDVPYGTTCAYSDIANALGEPKSVRAVGGAIGKNPIGIVVPCHRVVGRNGSITGYAGGVENKIWLLAHETKHGGGSQASSARSVSER